MADRIIKQVIEDLFEHRVSKDLDAGYICNKCDFVRNREAGNDPVQFLPLWFVSTEVLVGPGELDLGLDCPCC